MHSCNRPFKKTLCVQLHAQKHVRKYRWMDKLIDDHFSMSTLLGNCTTQLGKMHTHWQHWWSCLQRAKALFFLSLVGGPDKSNKLTGKQAVMFGQTYLSKALTLLSLSHQTLLPLSGAPASGFNFPMPLPGSTIHV